MQLTDATVKALREAIAAGRFSGVSFQQAMRFALTDGMMPADDLPVSSLLDLETFLRQDEAQTDCNKAFTATQLKNETGTVLRTAQRDGSPP